MKMLLIENDGYVAQKNELIFEGSQSIQSDADDPSIIYAVLQKAGVKNNNGRVYSKELLEREMMRYRDTVIGGGAMFEVNHPETTSINLLNVGCILVDYWWEGVTLMGKLKLILSKAFISMGGVFTPGDVIRNHLDNKVRIGISSRGVGSLKKVNGTDYVQDDFSLICWDFVNSPSSIDSWVSDEKNKLNQYIHKEAITVEKNDNVNNLAEFLKMLKNNS